VAKGSASGIKAGRAYVELGVNDKLTKGLRAAQARLKAFGGAVRNIGLGMVGAATAAAAPLAASVKLFSDVGDAVAKAAARTGMSTEAMSELGFAAEQSGADMESLEKGVRIMQRTMVEAADGAAGAQDAFDALGISVKDLEGLSPDEQFAAIAERIKAIEDPARRTAAAMDIFGRAGAQLIPLLAEGASGIEALRQEARDFGISIGGKGAKAAEILNDTFNRMSKAVRGIWLNIGAALAPAVTDLTQRMAKIAAATSKWVAANRPLIVTTAKVIAIVGAVGAALIAVGLSISFAGVAIGGLATAFGLAIKAVLLMKMAFLALASPVGLVAVALGGGIAALLYFTGAGGTALDWLRDRFSELRDRVTAVLGAIGDAMKAGDLALAAKIAWLAIKAEWIRGTGWLRDIWTEVKTWFLQSWSEVVGGVQLFAAEAWSTFETAAAEAFAFVSRAWLSMTTFFRGVWESVTGWMGDRIIDVMSLFDESLDATAAKAARRATDDAGASALEKERAAQERLIAGRLEGRKNASTNALAARKDAIGGGLIDDQRAIATARDAALAETADALAKAQEELRGAMEEARKAREDAAEEGPLAARRPAFADAIDGLDGARAKSESRGIFAAAAIQSLQAGGGRPLDRIAKATEDTAKNVATLVRKASSDGLVFQE